MNNEDTKLVQDFLEANNLLIQQQPLRVRQIDDGSVIIEKPFVNIVRKTPPKAAAITPSEVVPEKDEANAG